MSGYAQSSGLLLLLATERQVYAFNMSTSSRVTIGRHDSNDLQLASRTVSNFHAEIIKDNDGLIIRDLGSTNGTHLNDNPVESGPLSTGDRIRIGNHVMTMQLKPVDGPDDAFLRYQKSPQVLGPGARGRIISFRGRSADALKTIRGVDPNDFTFPDLLRLLATSGDIARALLTRGSEAASVYVRKQSVIHAEYGTARGEKALYRIFGWMEGDYEIQAAPTGDTIPRSISLPIDTLVLEGMAHPVELGRLVATLPPMEAPLRLKEDCPLPMTAHSPDEIEMFQLIVRHETIARVLNTSALTDVRVLRLVDSLIRKGVFEMARGAETPSDTLFPVSTPNV